MKSYGSVVQPLLLLAKNNKNSYNKNNITYIYIYIYNRNIWRILNRLSA